MILGDRVTHNCEKVHDLIETCSLFNTNSIRCAVVGFFQEVSDMARGSVQQNLVSLIDRFLISVVRGYGDFGKNVYNY